jgi:superfamily I DNA and/or RNA helicase
MFERLIKGGYPHTMLRIAYRMHPLLLRVPNLLAYQNKIESGYKPLTMKTFLSKDAPFLFIDVKGKERLSGTSFFNIDEAKVVASFASYWVENSEDFADPSTKLHSLYFISPYSA